MTTGLGPGLIRVVLGAALLAAGVVRAQEPDAKALVKQVIEAVPKNSFSATLTVSGKEFPSRVLRMNRKYVDGAHGSYLEVIAPDELKGVRFLFIERVDKPYRERAPHLPEPVGLAALAASSARQSNDTTSVSSPRG